MSDLSQLQIKSMRERVSREEWATRTDLAACYRLVHHFGMDDLVYNHISARVPGEEGHFLINAYGMTYDEVTAALEQLRIAPLLRGVRGEAPLDIAAYARMAVALGDAMLGWRSELASADINPVMVFETGALAVDALLERAL